MLARNSKSRDADVIVESPGEDLITAETAVKAVKAGRAKDVDIAAQIIAENTDHAGEAWTAQDDKKLMWKVDMRLIPIVSLGLNPPKRMRLF